MKNLRPTLLALWLLVASASAAATSEGGFAATNLEAAQGASMEGDIVALFAIFDARATSWDLTAAGVTIDRAFANYTSVYSPLSPEANAYTHYDDGVQTLTFGAARVTSVATYEGGALLVRGLDAPSFAAHTEEPLVFSVARDPHLRQGDPRDVFHGARSTYLVEGRLAGSFLNVTGAGVTLDVRGDLELHLSGADYALVADGARYAGETGFHAGVSAVAARTGHAEKHILTLTDAHLRITIPSEAWMFTRALLATVDGPLSAGEPQGALVVDGDTVVHEESPAGDVRAQLALAPDGGLVAARDAALLGYAGAAIPQVPLPPWALALAALAVAAALGLAALAARRRRARDPLDAAILAMEERRYADALPHFERVLRARPEDVVLRIDHALCLEQVGRLHDARAGFERALRAAPAHAETHYYFARTLARLGESALARDHLARALDLDPRLEELARRELGFRAFSVA